MNDELLRIVRAEYHGEFRILLTFNNNETYIVDLKSYVQKKNTGVFAPLQDVEYLKKFKHVDNYTIQWPNEADIAPEYLYELAINQNKSA